MRLHPVLALVLAVTVGLAGCGAGGGVDTETTTGGTTTDEASSTTGSDRTSDPTDAASTPTATPLPQDRIEVAVDRNGTAVLLSVRANTSMLNVDSEDENPGDPLLVVSSDGRQLVHRELAREGTTTVDVAIPASDFPEEVRGGSVELTVRLLDRDSLFDDELASWTGSVEVPDDPDSAGTPASPESATARMETLTATATGGTAAATSPPLATNSPASSSTRTTTAFTETTPSNGTTASNGTTTETRSSRATPRDRVADRREH